MKRFIASLTVGLSVITLAACGSNAQTDTSFQQLKQRVEQTNQLVDAINICNAQAGNDLTIYDQCMVAHGQR